jgi:hypothetical protein
MSDSFCSLSRRIRETETLKSGELTDCDWEKLARQEVDGKSVGHESVVRKLREIVKSKYGLETEPFGRIEKDVRISEKRTPRRTYYHVPHKPDLIITDDIGRPERRVLIEYVNSEGRNSSNFLRDLRGMIAFEAVMKVKGLKALKFILALRDSFAKKYTMGRPIVYFTTELLSLHDMLRYLDKGGINRLAAFDRFQG